LGQPRDYNELYILVSENALDRQHIRAVAQSVRDKMERSGLVVTSTSTPVPGKHPLEDPAQAVMLLLGVLGFFSLIFSGSLVANTLSAVLAQQVRQIGMMKAIGARTYQVAGIYLGMALILGWLAVIIGAPLGMLGARGLAGLVAGLLNADIVNPSIPFMVLVLEAIIGLVEPPLTALFPVVAGSRVTVRDALNDYGLDTHQFGIEDQPTRDDCCSRVLFHSTRGHVACKCRMVQSQRLDQRSSGARDHPGCRARGQAFAGGHVA